MGTFRQKVIVSNIENPNSKHELKMVVDTGATYTLVPQDLLASMNIKSRFKRTLKLADGRLVECDAGVVNITLNGETLPTVCIFGEIGSEPLLGAVTLEEFGLGVDTINKTLTPIPAYLLEVR